MHRFFGALALIALASCDQDGPDQEKELGKRIEITPASFSDVYPAVWFSPSDAEVRAIQVEGEEPPGENFEIWIEPRDPEIGVLNEAKNDLEPAFAWVGNGSAAFEKLKIPADSRIVQLDHRHEFTPNNVYLLERGEQAYLMMIESISPDEQTLTFRWRQLRPEERE